MSSSNVRDTRAKESPGIHLAIDQRKAETPGVHVRLHRQAVGVLRARPGCRVCQNGLMRFRGRSMAIPMAIICRTKYPLHGRNGHENSARHARGPHPARKPVRFRAGHPALAILLHQGRPPRVPGRPASPPDLFASAAVAAFRGFVQNPQFSCVGAKSAVAHESARLGVYDRLGSAGATAGLARDLWTFTHDPDTTADNDYVTFVALFKGPTELDEAGFEDRLWKQLRQLNRLDAPLHAWDPTVSPDPDDPHFGFSFAGTAFFVVGLHPHSSRGGSPLPLAAAGVQPARPVHSPAGGRAVGADAGRDPHSRAVAAGVAQPEPGRPRRRDRGPSVLRPPGGAGLAPAVHGSNRPARPRTAVRCATAARTPSHDPAPRRPPPRATDGDRFPSPPG